MKFLASAIVLLASTAAFAYPTVGDHVLMSGTATMNGQTAPFTLERTIKSFDSAAQQYIVSETQTIAGNAQTQDSPTAAADMLSADQVQQILSMCAMYSGTTETITVKAGTFATCKLPLTDQSGAANGFGWIGDVEFGIVKVTGNNNGVDYVLEVEQHSGN